TFFALAVMVISLLFSIYKARRGLSFICITILMASYFVYLKNAKNKILTLYLSIFAIILGYYYVTAIYDIKNNNLLSFIAERGDQDTRTGVELYFYDDMKTIDWL